MNKRPLRLLNAIFLVGMGAFIGCNKQPHQNTRDSFQTPPQGYAVAVANSGSTNVDVLVEQLVSKRPAPYRSGYGDFPEAAIFADRYCTPEVAAALKSLKQMGPPIFPALVRHLGDDRYSYSQVVAAWLNFSVGSAIVDVLSDDHYMHSGYKARKTPSGSKPYLSFNDYLRMREAKAWADWAKTKTRLEIQTDFIDWCITQENERGYIDDTQKAEILENYERARQQVSEEYSKQNRPAAQSSNGQL